MAITRPAFPASIGKIIDHIGTYADTADALRQLKSEKNAANGYAGLTAEGRLPANLVPGARTSPKDPLWGPSAIATHGAIADNVSHPLSGFFATLTAAQAVYPHATALTDELDWAAAQKAVNTAPSIPGTTGKALVLDMGQGVYVSNRTLEVKDYNVRMIGWGGRANSGQLAATGGPTPAQTIWKITANVPGIHFKETSYTDTESRYSTIEEMAITGNRTGAAQHGLIIDNRGTSATRVTISECGGNGWEIRDSVGATYLDCWAFNNVGNGLYIDHRLRSDPAGGTTIGSFFNFTALGNDGVNIFLDHGAWGFVFFGGFTEGAGSWGIKFGGGVASADQCRFNRFYHMWDELNGPGPTTATRLLVRFEQYALDNEVFYGRYTSGLPSHALAYNRNIVSGVNLANTGTAQRILHRFVDIGSAGPIDTADFDMLRVRNADDTDLGKLLVKQLLVGYGGTAVAPGAPMPSDLGIGDGINIRNGAGLASLVAGISKTWAVLSGTELFFGYAGADSVKMDAAVVDAQTGDMRISTAGKGLKVKEGTNAKQGVATLAAGSVVVANTSVTATSRIFLTPQSPGGTGTPGWVRVSARTAGTSFTITSSSADDTSIIGYEIFEPA